MKIIERGPYDTRAKADQMKAIAEAQDGGTWTAEVFEEGGKFFVRAFAPDFGSSEKAMNVGGEPVAVSPGAPATAASGGVKGLLDFISKFESGGNYNAFFRHADNQNNPKFTQMTLANVIKWQRNHTKVNGAPSSAAGRYQIIRGTLSELVKNMGLDPDNERYTQKTQDDMAIKLLEEKGLKAYLAGTKTAEAFANDVTRIWAALPIVTDTYLDQKKRSGRKGFSYYSGDGLNKSHVGVESYLRAVVAARA